MRESRLLSPATAFAACARVARDAAAARLVFSFTVSRAAAGAGGSAIVLYFDILFEKALCREEAPMLHSNKVGRRQLERILAERLGRT